jgi:hypothetical protein
MGGAYRVFMQKPGRKRSLGRPWEDNIKMYSRIDLGQDRDR